MSEKDVRGSRWKVKGAFASPEHQKDVVAAAASSVLCQKFEPLRDSCGAPSAAAPENVCDISKMLYVIR